MSNENSNLRVGSAGAGLFVGDKQILGGVENLLNEISIAPDFVNEEGVTSILVVNLSTKELTLTRNDVVTTIPKQHIEWYSYSGNASIGLKCNEPVYAIQVYYGSLLGNKAAYGIYVGTDIAPLITYPQNVSFYTVFIVMDNV